MRLFFPYKPSNRIGGPTAFANAFLRHTDGLEVTANLRDEIDVALFFIHITEEAAQICDERGVPKVLRLDNIYHDTAIDYPALNAPIFESIDRADAVVFQSEFSRRFVTHYYGKPIDKPWAIIHNGADNGLFKPSDEPFDPDRVRILFNAAIHPQKRLHEALRLFRSWKKPNWQFYVLGDLLHYPPYLVDELQDAYGEAVLTPAPNIHYYGNQPRTKLPEIMAAADICFCPNYRDSCPNSVLEALACGLPVLCENTGGTPELVQDGGVVVGEWSENMDPMPYQARWNEIALLDDDLFTVAINDIVANYSDYRQRALARAQALNISNTVCKYTRFFEAVLAGATPMEEAS